MKRRNADGGIGFNAIGLGRMTCLRMLTGGALWMVSVQGALAEEAAQSLVSEDQEIV